MSENTMNEAGNQGGSVTVELPTEATRRELIALRVKHGANTPIGHRASNLICQIEMWDRANGGGEWPDLLMSLLQNSVAELAELTK